jgi:drug/metabolite transporter (DMT)-like permease
MSESNKVVIYIKLLVTAFLWGGTFIAGRVVARNVGPFSAAFLRFAVASIFLLFITYKIEKRLPPVRKGQVIPLILLGMTGVFSYNVFFFKGLKIIHAGRAAVIIACNPVVIALFASYLFKERLTLPKFAGIVISVTGAIVVISRGNPIEIMKGNVGLGEFFIFGCVMSWAAYSLIGKAVMKDLSPLLSVAYSSVVGAVGLFVPAYLEGVVGHFLLGVLRHRSRVCLVLRGNQGNWCHEGEPVYQFCSNKCRCTRFFLACRTHNFFSGDWHLYGVCWGLPDQFNLCEKSNIISLIRMVCFRMKPN